MADEKLPIAILAAAGFGEVTFTDTQKTLISKGRSMRVISPDGGLVQGWHADTWGHHFMADESIGDSLAADYCGLILPDGRNSALTLSENPHTKRLIAAFLDAEQPVLVIGEAISLLVTADVAAGRRIAGDAELGEELSRAGAHWVPDEGVVIDGTLITATTSSTGAALIETFLGMLTDRSVPQAA
jgi:protease I